MYLTPQQIALLTPQQIMKLPLYIFTSLVYNIYGINSVIENDCFFGYVLELIIKALCGLELSISSKGQKDINSFCFYDRKAKSNIEIKCNRGDVNDIKGNRYLIYCPLLNESMLNKTIEELPIYRLHTSTFKRMVKELNIRLEPQIKKGVPTGDYQLPHLYNHSGKTYGYHNLKLTKLILRWLANNAEKININMF